jgi:hypothetical protein
VILGVAGALLVLVGGLYLLRGLIRVMVAYHTWFVLGFLALVVLWCLWASLAWLRHRLRREWGQIPEPEEPPSP